MTKRILVVLAMLPTFAMAADLTPGVIEVTGSSNLGFDSSSSKFEGAANSTDTTRYGLDLTGIYYLTPNVGVGLRLGYTNEETKFAGAKSGVSTLLLGPAVGFEVPIQDKLAFAAQGDIGYASATFTESGQPDTNASGWGLGLGAGVKYYVVPAFSMNAGLVYNYTKLTYDATAGSPKQDLTSSGFGLNVGFSVYFGR
jgi:hypothetical protein